LFASSRLLVVPLVSLFVAAIVLSLFAWRQIRISRSARPSVAENAKLASAVDNAPRQPVAAPAVITPGVQTETRASTNAIVPAVTAVPNSAAKTRMKAVVTKAAPKSHPAAAQVSLIKAEPADSKLADSKPADSTIANSNLEIHIENRFSDAILAIWIDDKLAYSHPLHDGHKKRLMLLGGGVKETVAIPIAAGKHALRVGVRSASEQYDQSKTVAGEFPKDGERILSINFEKHTKEMRVTLAGE